MSAYDRAVTVDLYDRVILQGMLGITRFRVCAVKDASDEEVLEVTNRQCPAGTERGWTTVIRSGTPEQGGPVECAQDQGRVHLIVVC